jgi:hypothetical protein
MPVFPLAVVFGGLVIAGAAAFLTYWPLGKEVRARLVSYAGDLSILSRGRAPAALAWTKAMTTKLGIAFNEAKTSLKNALAERFLTASATCSDHISKLLAQLLSLTLANSEQAHRPRGMRNIGSLSTIS